MSTTNKPADPALEEDSPVIDTPAADGTGAEAKKKNTLKDTLYIAITQPGAATAKWFEYGGQCKGRDGTPDTGAHQFFGRTSGNIDQVAYLKKGFMEVGPAVPGTALMDSKQSTKMFAHTEGNFVKFTAEKGGPTGSMIPGGPAGTELLTAFRGAINEAKADRMAKAASTATPKAVKPATFAMMNFDDVPNAGESLRNVSLRNVLLEEPATPKAVEPATPKAVEPASLGGISPSLAAAMKKGPRPK